MFTKEEHKKVDLGFGNNNNDRLLGKTFSNVARKFTECFNILLNFEKHPSSLNRDAAKKC